MTDTVKCHYRRWGHAALTVLLTLFVAGPFIHWAWNTIGAGLFKAPEVRFVHVLALYAGMAALILPPFILARQLRFRG